MKVEGLREKVIDGLEHCSEDGCKGCPYEQDCKMCDGFSLLAKDALELLKEQEPAHIQKREFAHMWFWCCGSCGVAITEGDKFCRMCGQAVKWDEAD